MTTRPAVTDEGLGGQLLTPAEAATELRIGVSALRYLEAKGRLGWRAVRLPGGHRRYPQERIRALREEREAMARPGAGEAAGPPGGAP